MQYVFSGIPVLEVQGRREFIQTASAPDLTLQSEHCTSGLLIEYAFSLIFNDSQ